MRLVEISFSNFRQFYGKQHFSFSQSQDRPANIIFGANGSGKTTFLNAFTWVLYGTLSDDVETQNRLINNNAWDEVAVGEDGQAEVSLRFMHDGKSYKATRKVKATKFLDINTQTLQPSELELTVAEEHLPVQTSETPQLDISNILPKHLAQFFFFNGERMENLIKNSSYSDVKQEVKGLLDLSQVERAADESLPKVQRQLTSDLKKEDSGQAFEIEESIQDVQSDLDLSKKEHEDFSKNISESKKLISALKLEQEKIQNIRPLLQERDSLDQVIQEADEDKDRLEAQLNSIVKEDGFLAFTNKLTAFNQKKISDLKKKGSLPAPMSKEFLNSLIEEEQCVCGTSLAEGTEERRRLEEAKAASATTETTHFWNILEGAIPSISDKCSTIRQEVQSARQQLTGVDQKRQKAASKKAEIVTKLEISHGSAGTSDPALLQKRISETEKEMVRHEIDKHDSKKKIDTLETELASLKTQRNAAKTSGEVAEKIRSRIRVVEEVTDALHEIYKIRAARLNSFLNEKLREYYHSISHQNHEPYLTDDFELGLQDVSREKKVEVAKSTGENQILTICFLAAVSKAAQEQLKKISGADSLAVEEKAFPIVMDAAFGSLDESYQREVTSLLAKISSQLVILVSKSQGQGQVDKALQDYVDDRGIIVTHTTYLHARDEKIVLEGGEYPYVMRDDSDYSEMLTIEGEK